MTMVRRSGWRSGMLAAGAVLAMMAAPALGQSLEKRIQLAVSGAKLGNAKVGISVVDAQSGKALCEIRSASAQDETFIPASNLKLLTSGAALITLGKDFEFRTTLTLDGERLIVKGAGDPALADPQLLDAMKLSVDQLLDRLVDSVKTKGTEASGGQPVRVREVVMDDRVFDRELVHPEWPKEQLDKAYCAQVCGVNFHGNVLSVYVSPAGGSDAVSRTEPSGNWITIRRTAKFVKEGTTAVGLSREAEPYTFKLYGSIRGGLDAPVQVTVDDPATFMGKALADRLQKAGVNKDGANISVRLAGPNEEFSGGTVVGVVRTPISVVLERCNVDSDNLHAESLVKLAGWKSTGQPGSWASGTAVVRMKVRELLGADMATSMALSDGSGLSRNNRVTPELLTRWMSAVARSPVGDAYVRSLAVAGEEGTLKKRFRGAKLKNEVRAKSGYIREVRTLSGFVTNLSTGRRIAFSVLVNNVPGGADARAKELHEKVVEIVDQWLAEQK